MPYAFKNWTKEDQGFLRKTLGLRSKRRQRHIRSQMKFFGGPRGFRRSQTRSFSFFR